MSMSAGGFEDMKLHEAQLAHTLRYVSPRRVADMVSVPIASSHMSISLSRPCPFPFPLGRKTWFLTHLDLHVAAQGVHIGILLLDLHNAVAAPRR